MKKVLSSAAAFGILAICANASIINFDSLSGAGPVPNGYGGLNWNNFNYLDGPSVGGGYAPGTVSPRNVAFNAFANPALVSDGIFDLNSAYLTAAWNDNLQVRVTGKLGINTLYVNTYTLSATAPTLINFSYLGIDSVLFESFGGTHHLGYSGAGEHFALDNMEINAVVPEPSTYIAGALLLLPFGAHVVRRLRTHKQVS